MWPLNSVQHAKNDHDSKSLNGIQRFFNFKNSSTSIRYTYCVCIIIKGKEKNKTQEDEQILKPFCECDTSTSTSKETYMCRKCFKLNSCAIWVFWTWRKS